MGQNRLRIAIFAYDSGRADWIKDNLKNFPQNARRTGFY
jgi:hypothetical protein